MQDLLLRPAGVSSIHAGAAVRTAAVGDRRPVTEASCGIEDVYATACFEIGLDSGDVLTAVRSRALLGGC